MTARSLAHWTDLHATIQPPTGDIVAAEVIGEFFGLSADPAVGTTTPRHDVLPHAQRETGETHDQFNI